MGERGEMMERKDFYTVNECEWFIPVKLIEEDKYTKTLEVEAIESGSKILVPNIYKFKKVEEPQKPVVPKFVVEWVDDWRKCGFDFDEWFDCNNQPKIIQLWLNQENKRQAELNALALVTFIVNGANAVEIEQEQLYTVEIEGVDSSKLFKNTRTNEYIFHSGKELELYTDKLTEQEIKKADERLWEFAKPVEDK